MYTVYIQPAMTSLQSQLFCKKVSFDLIEPYLQKICTRCTDTGAYILDETAFSLLMFHGMDTDFINTMRPYYHNSKLNYVDRKLTFKSFSTIVRQICKATGKNISSKIKYFHSAPLTVITILP